MIFPRSPDFGTNLPRTEGWRTTRGPSTPISLDATEGIPMNRAVNRLVARLVLLGTAVVLGGLAVAHTQKGLDARKDPAAAASATAQPATTQSANALMAGIEATSTTDSIPAPIPMPDALNPQELPPPLPATDDAIAGYATDDSPPPPLPSLDETAAAPPPAMLPMTEDAADPGVRTVQAELPATDENSMSPPEDVATDMNMSQSAGDESGLDPQPDALTMEPAPGPQSIPPAAPPENYYPSPDATGRLPNDVTDETFSGAASVAVRESRNSDASNSDSQNRVRGTRSSGDRDMGHRTNIQAGDGIEGAGKPGPEQISGPQTPSLTIRKTAPAEVSVGKPAKLEITVKNIGTVAAEEVVVRDEVPAGARLINTTPAAETSRDGVLLWHLGTIEPNAEATAVMEVLPIQEGEIGSVASVAFQVSTSARSLATRPQLQVEHTGPAQVLAGEDVVFNIKLSNPGTGVATNVVIQEVVPEGLQHFDGRELEYPVGSLRPGETRLLELKLKAKEPGKVENVLVARADADIHVEDVYQLEVVAPQLSIDVEGPKRRYLNRKAAVQITVANPGTAPARRVELVAKLPRGVKFVNTNNAGQYDASRHVVVWNLEELPAGEMGTVEIQTNAVEMGRQEFHFEARSASGLSDVATHDITVEGMAALLFTVTDVNDPIEIGGETTYDVQIVNQGSKASNNLRLAAILPEGMEAVAGEGPTRESISGKMITFEPMTRLAPQASSNYRIRIRGTTPGDKRVQIKLISDEVEQPVTKEESTHVYADG